MSKLSRKQIEKHLRKGKYIEGIPNKHWEIDGKIYLSKEEMPENIRLSIEETDRLELLYENQKKRFCVNEVEYDTIEEVPKKYRDNLKSMMESHEQEKYRLTVKETPLKNQIFGFAIATVLIFGFIYLFLALNNIL